MTGEDAKRRLLMAIKEFRNEEVSRLLNADPGLLDTIYRGQSIAEFAIDSKNFPSLLLMCGLLAHLPTLGVETDQPKRPSPSRFLRVSCGFDNWTAKESEWIDCNPEAAKDEQLLREALRIAGWAELELEDGSYQVPASIAKNNCPPGPARVFAVVSGLSVWTDEEKTWLKQNPEWLKHEEDLRATLRKIQGKPPNETAEEHRNRLLKSRQNDPPSPN